MNGRIHARFSLKYIAATAILAIAVIFTGFMLVSMTYEKAIVRYLKGYLENHLTTRLSLDENIRFHFLKGFPNTTIEIRNVLLLSGTDFSRSDFGSSFSDTLLYAEKAFLRFNPFKILRKDYELKKIEISKGCINILFDNQNNNNLNIWKSDKSTSTDYSVNLKNILITDTRVRIESVNNHLRFDGKSIRTNFKGKLSSDMLSGETRGNFRIRHITVRDKPYVIQSNLQLDIQMVYSSSRFRVSRGTMQLNRAIANFSGDFTAGKNKEIDLNLDIPRFGLNELISILPITIESGKYEFDGKGHLKLSIKGPIGRSQKPVITSNFVLNNGIARNKETKSSISGVNARGYISGTNTGNFRVQVDTFYARLGKGDMKGAFSIRNLSKPIFDSEIKTYLDLNEFRRFAGLDSFEFSGFMQAHIRTSGNTENMIADSLVTLLQTLKKGTFEFENVKVKGKQINLEGLNGRAMWDETLRADSLFLTTDGTRMLVEGEINNPIAYLSGKGILIPELNITCDLLDITKYLTRKSRQGEESGFKSPSLFPDRIHGKAHIKTNKFIAGKFEASDVSVDLAVFQDSMSLSPFMLRFPDGYIKGKASVTTGGNRYTVTCKAQPDKINISKMFYACNNFSQRFILDKNLEGYVGGDIDFYAQWDSALKIMPATVKVIGQIQINNGELIQFDPMLKLSKYIDVEELKHIKFRTLKNSIYISDRMVSIPEMDINSSAFNISLSGQHSFDNDFDYRLRVLLSQVLFNKARKKKKEIDEFLVDESTGGQTTIPLIIAGKPSDFDVRFDRKKAFRLSRDPNSIKPKPDNAGNIRVEWDEPKETPADKPLPSSKSQDIVIEWEE